MTLTILGMIGFWIYRFSVIGWPAWHGNLRIAALCAAGLGLVGQVGPVWTFGIRKRKVALIVLLAGVIVFLVCGGVEW